jgi:hypothetical protein
MKKVIILSIVSMLSLTSFSQTDQGKTKTETAKSVSYTCPMHSDVTSDKAGKCPKCGMNLVAKKTEAKKTFICPMHSDITSDKAGKCSKCGMNLVEKKAK